MPTPRRSLQALAVALALGVSACASPAPSGSAPGSSIAPSAPSSTGAATATPTVAPSPTARPSEPLVIAWTRGSPSGLRPTDSFSDLLATDGGIVLAASIPDETSFRTGLWRSTDGQAWSLVEEQEDEEQVSAFAAGGPGIVAVGRAGKDAAVWLSSDGSDWERVKDSSLANGNASIVVTTDSGLVAFGSKADFRPGGIWTSPDGRDWLAATNESGVEVATGLQTATSFGGRAVAFVKRDETDPVDVWETTGRAEWERVGVLPDSATANVHAAAGGPAGWVAVGSADQTGKSVAWASGDGRAWRAVGSGPDVASDLVADTAGFIAVGYVGSLPGETCGDQRPFEMQTWTSVDGSTWAKMPPTEEGLASVLQAAVVDRTLLGVGLDWSNADPMSGTGAPATWTAPLPEGAVPAEASDESTAPETCGP